MSANYVRGQKVYWLNEKTGQKELYDFGYYSAVDGKAIIYEEGESNMQDSYVVEIVNLSPASERN